MNNRYLFLVFVTIYFPAFSQTINDTILLEEIIVIPSPFSNYVNDNNAHGNLHWVAKSTDLKEISFLNDAMLNAPSVHANDGTTNPVGQDIQIRGFNASPLYGLPQEIAVFADGVKKNDLLGDAIFWDLMPTFAMNQTQIFVGSQPLFGLNALGGTINYTSKSGFTNPERAVSLNYGSFNRFNAIAEYGQHKNNWGYYLGANHWNDDGWRAHSASKVTNIFGKLSYRQAENELDISMQYANSNLLGNGALPLELLNRKEWRNQVFTHPDRTENTLFEINTNWNHRLSKNTKGRLIFAYKNLDTHILNGDESPFAEYEAAADVFLILGEEEEEAMVETEELEYARNIEGDRIIATEKNSEAILNRNTVLQQSIALAYITTSKWYTNRINWELQSSLSFRGGKARYIANSQLGSFDETRAVSGTGELVTNFDTEVIANVKNLHATSGLSAVIDNNFAIQLSAAYNNAQLILEDQLGIALNGEHHFSNFLGGLSFYYLPNKYWMLHTTLNTSTRNPTSIEVSCADPDAPCRLPNAFLSDPPLNTVRAMTAQMGIAYNNNKFKFSSTSFLTNVLDDIYFVSAGAFRGAGYFDNIGNTRRIGWENSIGIKLNKRLKIGLDYTYLKATFQNEFKISAPNHPNAVQEELLVKKGNHLALIPNHNFKGKLSYQFSKKLELEWKQIYNSAQYIRGDEVNELEPLKDYWRHDIVLRYAMNDKMLFWGKVKNLGDNQYETFGLLGEADEAGELLGEELDNNVFAGPATPRYLEIGWKFIF